MMIMWSSSSGVQVQVPLFNEIFNLILKVAAFIGVVSDVIVKMTELRGITLGSVFVQGLWPTVVDLLLGGTKYIFPSVHEFSVFRVLGDISFFLESSSARGWS